jgi:hypothetical protein
MTLTYKQNTQDAEAGGRHVSGQLRIHSEENSKPSWATMQNPVSKNMGRSTRIFLK